MKRVYVWLASGHAAVAHRIEKGRTGCGIDLFDRRHWGITIDSQLLNPKRVRLCRVCWGSLAVPAQPPRLHLPPCEEDDP